MEILGKVSTPMEIGINLDSEESPLLEKDNLYRQVVGSLLYLSNCTRPDLSFSVGVLSRCLCSPREIHWKAVQRLFQYLNQSASCLIIIINLCIMIVESFPCVSTVQYSSRNICMVYSHQELSVNNTPPSSVSINESQ